MTGHGSGYALTGKAPSPRRNTAKNLNTLFTHMTPTMSVRDVTTGTQHIISQRERDKKQPRGMSAPPGANALLPEHLDTAAKVLVHIGEDNTVAKKLIDARNNTYDGRDRYRIARLAEFLYEEAPARYTEIARQYPAISRIVDTQARLDAGRDQHNRHTGGFARKLTQSDARLGPRTV